MVWNSLSVLVVLVLLIWVGNLTHGEEYPKITVQISTTENSQDFFPRLEGNYTTLNFTRCSAPFPPPYYGNVTTVAPQDGACVNLYKGENCTGEYISITSLMRPVQHLVHWKGFDRNVSSIGPCHPPCHSSVVDSIPRNKTTSITVYNHPDFRGESDELTIDDCTPIPKRLRGRISSIRTEGKVCLELHKFWDCSGRSIKLQKGSRHFHNLHNWRNHFTSGGISHCGFNCLAETKPKTAENYTIGQTHVQLYDMEDFTGISEVYHFDSGCVDITDEWEGEAMSIQTFGKCLNIFEEHNCNSSGSVLELNDANKQVHLNLTLGGFDRLVRSMSLCGYKNSKIILNTGTSAAESSMALIWVLAVIFVAAVGGLTSILVWRWNLNKNKLEGVTHEGHNDSFNTPVWHADTDSATLL